jgi:hypothetical protein
MSSDIPAATAANRKPAVMIFMVLPNVLDHRWLLVARLLPKRSEAESAGGVTRVAIRWIALFDFIILE